jgi:uncharacterized protein YbjT (DUF2867 family)
MKIVVIGGTGLVGSRTVDRLRRLGHEAVPASPRSGVDTLNDIGLREAFTGAEVVIDLADSPSYGDEEAMRFFRTATGNVLAAEIDVGVQHHVALSIVGAKRLEDNGYLRAKLAQERLVLASTVPHTVIHSTQFFEFLGRIADAAEDAGEVRLSPALVQPIAADDVADFIAEIASGMPRNGIIEVAGPERIPFDEIVRDYLQASGDRRRVVSDVHARYFGAELNDGSLLPGPEALLGPTAFEQWIQRVQPS